MIYGKESILHLFLKTPHLHLLVDGLFVELSRELRMDACAMIDDKGMPSIHITEGMCLNIQNKMRAAVEILTSHQPRPWTLFHWSEGSFHNGASFVKVLTQIALDFIMLHELGHLSRGHIDYYCSLGLDQSYIFEMAHLSPNQDINRVRITLELDADSIALYKFITLNKFLRKVSPCYSKMKGDKTFFSTLAFALIILFGMLSEESGMIIEKNATLKDIHSKSTHPLPTVRMAFSRERIIQLCLNNAEKKRATSCMNQTEALLIQLIKGGLFDNSMLDMWSFDVVDLCDFLNTLIDNIKTLSEETLIKNESRISHVIDSLQRERIQENPH